MGKIHDILISRSPEAPMTSIAEARAVAGKGLKGDRYYEKKGTFSPHPHRADFEMTMIEKEEVDDFAERSGLPFTAMDARRNLVTTGIKLNALVGTEFSIGEAKLKAVRLCEPCDYLAKTTYPETLKGLLHKGGLRVQILESGRIRIGDEIRELPRKDVNSAE